MAESSTEATLGPRRWCQTLVGQARHEAVAFPAPAVSSAWRNKHDAGKSGGEQAEVHIAFL